MADSIAHALIKQGIEKGRELGIEEGIEKGIDIGIEKGREEGREEGQEKELKKNILMCLGKRFKCLVPRDIQSSVNSYSDLIALESLLQRAWDSESMDEFREYLVR
jgi:flagellar biosynthesis/type III secretory pathway protein FliH